MLQVDLENRVAVITGAGGAIGSAMAMLYAKNGAKVVVAGLPDDPLDQVVQDIKAQGGQAAAVAVDVRFPDSVQEMLSKTVEIFGRLDILVNNAGINGKSDERKPIHQYSDDLWQRILDIDLNGVYYCSKYGARQMIKQNGGGCIINISSVVGVVPMRLQCAFAAAKAGVVNLSKAMALELAEYNIRVNVIAPGSILFEGTKALFYADPEKSEAMLSHIPQHRPGTPQDIANMACFLASDSAGYITGSLQVVDGGWISGFARNF